MVSSRDIREWILWPKSRMTLMIHKYRHFTIQRMPGDDLRTTTPINPQDFAFFKGINQAADRDGILTQNISNGLKAGNYRMCSINASMSHAPVIAAVAQRGSHDDCVYVRAMAMFEIGEVGYSLCRIPSVHGETQARTGQTRTGQTRTGKARKGQTRKGQTRKGKGQTRKGQTRKGQQSEG